MIVIKNYFGSMDLTLKNKDEIRYKSLMKLTKSELAARVIAYRNLLNRKKNK
tara:strand:- start:337 stop:492 length:156 start_codon:yes stop_codon:yes gene_type:complete